MLSPTTAPSSVGAAPPARWAAKDACSSRRDTGGLLEEHGKRRQIGVPFDQGRPRAEACHGLGEQRPHALADTAAVIVDQDGLAVGIVHGVAREVILADRLARYAEPVARLEPEIVHIG